MIRRVPTRALGAENGWASLLILQILSCVFLTMGHAHADEVIEVDVQGKERHRKGEILDFRGDRLTMKVGQREITIPAARIKEIDAEWIPSHVTADTDFAARDFESALNSYRTALKREQRTWVKRRILARIVRCQSMTGRDVSACQNFARLLSEDKDTPYFDSIPLAWHVAQPSPQLQALVKDWLGSQNEPAKRLIAASWLLTSPDRSAAMTVLRQIARLTGQETADLARAQLWRTQLVNVTTDSIDRWQQEIDHLPFGLRAGPYYLLGKAHAQLGNADQAALAFLRVPTLFSENARLSQLALFEAARVVEGANRRDEAVLLYRQTLGLNTESLEGQQARDRLVELTR